MKYRRKPIELCYVGKALSVWGIPTFTAHVKTCEQCRKKMDRDPEQKK